MTEFSYAKFIGWREIREAVTPPMLATPGIIKHSIGLWHDGQDSWGIKCRIDIMNPTGYIDLCNRLNNNRPGETHRIQKNDHVQMSPSTSTRYLCMLGLLDNRLAENPVCDVVYAVTESGVYFLYETKKTGRNTRISYCYRESDCHKKQNDCVIKGEMSENQKTKIMACLDDGVYFDPKMVDLPAVKFDDTEDSHDWFELVGFESTNDEPTIDMNIDTLVEYFEKAAASEWANV